MAMRQVYANGQTMGQHGDWHQDSNQVDDWTFLDSANPRWLSDQWVGATYFANETGQQRRVNFQSKAAVIFPSHLWHYREAPNAQASFMRTTIAFKLRRKTSKT